MKSDTHRRGAHSRELRIIAGAWRGRRWQFPPGAIRPTPDRVRETLFNWLQSRIVGAQCLDLFAGSGALGLEALSRGAAEVHFVESDKATATSLRTLLTQWGCTNATVRHDDAQVVLAGPAAAMDLVFLDPPFDASLLPAIAARLSARGWLKPGALIYVEHGAGVAASLPIAWHEIKSGRAGAVSYHLYEYLQSKDATQ
jgi:16S rRNA (guanine966-N2)-methyltransferase